MNEVLDIEQIKSQWNVKAVEIFFEMLKTHKTITGDTYSRACRKAQMPPLHIARTSSGLFKSMKAQGYIKKTKEYVLSEISSRPLPLYTVNQDKEVSKEKTQLDVA